MKRHGKKFKALVAAHVAPQHRTNCDHRGTHLVARFTNRGEPIAVQKPNRIRQARYIPAPPRGHRWQRGRLLRVDGTAAAPDVAQRYACYLPKAATK